VSSKHLPGSVNLLYTRGHLPEGGTIEHLLWMLMFMKIYPKRKQMSVLCDGADKDTWAKWVFTFLMRLLVCGTICGKHTAGSLFRCLPLSPTSELLSVGCVSCRLERSICLLIKISLLEEVSSVGACYQLY